MANNFLNEAFRSYQISLSINPNTPYVWNSLGLLYFQCSQLRESAGAFMRAIKADSEYSAAWFNIGILYTLIHRNDDAEEAFRMSNRCEKRKDKCKY